jgi:hypothetical protein
MAASNPGRGGPRRCPQQAYRSLGLVSRIAARRGGKCATIALGHRFLVIIFHIQQEQTPYSELATLDLTDKQRQSLRKRLVRRLEKLGYHVEMDPLWHVA